MTNKAICLYHITTRWRQNPVQEQLVPVRASTSWLLPFCCQILDPLSSLFSFYSLKLSCYAVDLSHCLGENPTEEVMEEYHRPCRGHCQPFQKCTNFAKNAITPHERIYQGKEQASHYNPVFRPTKAAPY